ncbi:cold-responsive protein kinase 1-like [Humulus lupulus]|uniref:cold-responsive protein kinase 1-like n=1 Tax=Humulus lupulus TaxID=3486 RepID=UPI002B410175|nr:cold-responsive protein kinase 1-like [Humulus lupulus]XP_062096960.1 cold-responsive protein kinase 1-like [Humulus lupulus]
MSCCFFFFRRKEDPSVRRIVEIDEVLSCLHNVRLFSYRELRIATENFSPGNKIGQGGFGSVYKAKLKDGTLVAIKVLSAESSQGVKEFLTEINVIADIEHDNLVKLHGCCVEENQRILVYGYLENNSLEQTLLGGSRSNIQFGWPTRRRICIDVAQGLAFLHEEVQPHIIHRDIKASNVLLDKGLGAKISDFGLAKIIPANLTHISTRVAGTVGYLAPEYAIRGQVTRKADIYSFGVLLLEIVSGRSNTNRRLPANEQYLLERAWRLYESGELDELVDSSLNDDLDLEEARKFLKIALLCTQDMPKLRPPMSTIVEMLTGKVEVNDKEISKPGLLSEFMEMKDRKGERNKINSTSYMGSANSGSSGMTTVATMTFTSILDRSN